jgi:hypothetical protein
VRSMEARSDNAHEPREYLTRARLVNLPKLTPSISLESFSSVRLRGVRCIKLVLE